MSTARFTRILVAALACAGPLRAGPDEEARGEDVPAVGRPVDLPFSEASGWFEARAAAGPTTLEAETPLTFTLTVKAVRPTRRPPQRIDLRQLPSFDEGFYIEDDENEVVRPDDQTWQFAYRLKPRRPDVTEIPGLPFVYFNPYLLTTDKGFQVIYTDPIPIQVLPHETVHVPVQAPESAFTVTTGPELLERRTPWVPGGATTAAVLLAPPAACLIWYVCWRRMYPDAARQASQRRSRAARRALEKLHAARGLAAAEGAGRAASAVADYLRDRLDLGVAEPTPREVAALFQRRQLSPGLTEQAVRFFVACDGARFLPASAPPPTDLPDVASQLILAVEAETCPPASS